VVSAAPQHLWSRDGRGDDHVQVRPATHTWDLHVNAGPFFGDAQVAYRAEISETVEGPLRFLASGGCSSGQPRMRCHLKKDIALTDVTVRVLLLVRVGQRGSHVSEDPCCKWNRQPNDPVRVNGGGRSPHSFADRGDLVSSSSIRNAIHTNVDTHAAAARCRLQSGCASASSSLPAADNASRAAASSSGLSLREDAAASRKSSTALYREQPAMSSRTSTRSLLTVNEPKYHKRDGCFRRL